MPRFLSSISDAESPRRKFIALAIASLFVGSAIASAEEPKSAAKVDASPQVLCLHTEFMPIKDDEVLRFRQVRELGRQALLIAARDELGLTTRDETLGEVFPEPVLKAKQDLFISVRGQYAGDVRFQIWPASKPEELQPTKKNKEFNPRIVLNVTENLEPRIRGELPGTLRALGFEGKIVPPDETNLPHDSVEGQLLEMNFVSQFAAVRAAHAAIAEKGQSRAWLGVLARGYANLSLLTEHHWKSDSEVFAARALLYAQRLVAGDANDLSALANRAYVWAVVGLHGPALDEVKHIAELRKQHSDQTVMPGWYELIEPYCSFEREPVLSMVAQRKSLRELAQRLSFEQIRAFGDPRWLFDSARKTMALCPEEYGVYAALTSNHATLAGGRTGAYYAPAALAHFLPTRIAQLDMLPSTVRDAAFDSDRENKSEGNAAKPKEAESAGEYAAATMPIVESLRAATQIGNDKGEPSWSALGEMIFEEQFVQAANYLNVAMNATESSHADEVKSILTALKGHPYARHIEAYATPDKFYDTLGDMPIIDPRGNMRPLILRIWQLDSQNKKPRGPDAAWCAMYDRGLTFNSMQEADNGIIDYWWSHMADDIHQRWVDSYRFISPHSPQALRYVIQLTATPSDEQLNQWESEAGEDPTVYSQLGKAYSSHQRFDDAIRAFERSIDLSPTMGAFQGLANTYRAAGQEEKWQPTLERFFQTEPLGLEHAQVHYIIANDLMDKGKWEEAAPHATAAGETWSNWGLLLASEVEEGLGHWDDSEKWIQAAANSYPSSSGPEWYFWCRRTGRGNLEEARKVAQTYFARESLKTDVAGQLRVFTFHMTENDAHAAFDDLKRAMKLAADAHTPPEDMVRAQVQVAIVSGELKEADVSNAAVKEARQLIEQFREKDPKLGATYTTICDVLDGQVPTDGDLTTVEQDIDAAPKEVRVNSLYFLGRAYDLAGNQDQAEKYWKQCVLRGPFDRYPATLAGKYLCDRHQTSRQ